MIRVHYEWIELTGGDSIRVPQFISPSQVSEDSGYILTREAPGKSILILRSVTSEGSLGGTVECSAYRDRDPRGRGDHPGHRLDCPSEGASPAAQDRLAATDTAGKAGAACTAGLGVPGCGMAPPGRCGMSASGSGGYGPSRRVWRGLVRDGAAGTDRASGQVSVRAER